MSTRRMIIVSLLAALLIGMGMVRAWSAPPIRANLETLPRIGAVSSGTNINQWRLARSAPVTANDTTPDPNGQTWEAAVGSYFQLDPRYSTFSVAFYCYGDGTGDGDPNAGTFDANVYIVEPYGSWERIASVTCAVGELELTHYPAYDGTNQAGAEINSGSLDPNQSYKWVEGIFTDNLSDSDIWPTTVGLSGESNGIGRLNVDYLGATGLIILIDNMDGGGTAVTRVYPVVKER